MMNEQIKPQLTIPRVRRSYLVVKEIDVVNIILKTSENWQGCGIITPSNIAHLLETSRYQVNKYIKSLKQKRLIDYKSVEGNTDEEYYPPINGYCLSKIGREFYKKELKELSDRECELIQQCFGS